MKNVLFGAVATATLMTAVAPAFAASFDVVSPHTGETVNVDVDVSSKSRRILANNNAKSFGVDVITINGKAGAAHIKRSARKRVDTKNRPLINIVTSSVETLVADAYVTGLTSPDHWSERACRDIRAKTVGQEIILSNKEVDNISTVTHVTQQNWRTADLTNDKWRRDFAQAAGRSACLAGIKDKWLEEDKSNDGKVSTDDIVRVINGVNSAGFSCTIANVPCFGELEKFLQRRSTEQVIDKANGQAKKKFRDIVEQRGLTWLPGVNYNVASDLVKLKGYLNDSFGLKWGNGSDITEYDHTKVYRR